MLLVQLQKESIQSILVSHSVGTLSSIQKLLLVTFSLFDVEHHHQVDLSRALGRGEMGASRECNSKHLALLYILQYVAREN